MRLFIDSANLDEIKEVDGWGIISGVTTNPTLIAKEGKDFKAVISQICRIIDGPVSVEVVGTRTEELIKRGREVASWHPAISVKLPMSEQAIKATRILSSDGIRTNISLIFSANQALLAALAGATYISPSIGKIDETGHDGITLIEEIRSIYDQYVFDTQVITSNILHPQHVTLSAKKGSDIASVPYKVLKQMFRHPLTESGAHEFTKDWNTIQELKVPQGV